MLAQGLDVNVLVLDTEVYSNTGGQSSKATPLGAVAKFAAAGKRTARKDLALQAVSYGNVYVAQVAMGANPQHTLQAFREAEAYDGPSLILAYSQCIAHGIDMRTGMHQQDLATASGYWPLFRFNPAMRTVGANPFRLDSPRPTIPFKDYAYNEIRYRSLAATRPEEARELLAAAQHWVDEKYRVYEDMAARDGSRFIAEARAPISAASRTAHGADGMNLVTSYLGLSLRNPLIASSSPKNAELDHLRRLDDAGVGAVVLPSLFQEQLEAEHDHYETILVASSADNSPEAQSYLPPIATGPYGLGPERHLDLVRRAKGALSVPVIASLNGCSDTGWTSYASLLEQAGADALELNIYDVPVDISVSGREIEQQLSRRADCGAHDGDDPGRGEDATLFQLDWPYGRPLRRCRRQRAGDLQPLSAAGYQPRTAWSSRASWPSAIPVKWGCHCYGRRSWPDGSRHRWRHRQASSMPTTS